MKILEYVEQEIEDLKKDIKDTKKEIEFELKTNKCSNKSEIIDCHKACLEEYEFELSNFKQVKVILNAWNSVKDKIDFQRGEFIPYLLAIKKGHSALTYQEYKNIQSALKVKDWSDE